MRITFVLIAATLTLYSCSPKMAQSTASTTENRSATADVNDVNTTTETKALSNAAQAAPSNPNIEIKNNNAEKATPINK